MSSIRQIVDPKLIKIIDLFLKNSGKFYHLHKISTDAKVPLATTHRLLKKLTQAGFFEVTSVGKTKLYKMNAAKKREYEVLSK
jgi:DNA-binding IclR family transcriptional regulator